MQCRKGGKLSPRQASHPHHLPLLLLYCCFHCFLAGTLPSLPPSAVSLQLSVYSTEGVRASVTVLPEVTTVGQLREHVAEVLGLEGASEVSTADT
jgi:hypothetical protein